VVFCENPSDAQNRMDNIKEAERFINERTFLGG